jgi:hypothetical protein
LRRESFFISSLPKRINLPLRLPLPKKSNEAH